MPMVDMSIEQLKQYQGSSPCPADFDAFWETALSEMKGTQRNVELVPASFVCPNAECFDLYFTGTKGARIHAKYVRPKQLSSAVPAVLQFHGYTGRADDWFGLLSYAGQGFCIAALDCRGQAGESEDVGGVSGNTHHGHFIRGLASSNPHDLLFRDIYLDTVALANIVMGFDEVDETRVMTFGGSQGGALATACAALEPRIWKASIMYPFLSDFKRVWEMDLDQGAYAELRTYFRFYDPLHEREDEIFEKLGYIDVHNLAKRIRAEVLFGLSQIDTTCPPSTQFAVYNQISSQKQMLIYPDFGHEGLPQFLDKTFAFFIK